MTHSSRPVCAAAGAGGEQKPDAGAKPEADDAYLSFLEDMKELGAIQDQ
jgi:hypothetical protein